MEYLQERLANCSYLLGMSESKPANKAQMTKFLFEKAEEIST